MNEQILSYIISGVIAAVSLASFITSLVIRFGNGKVKETAETVQDALVDVGQLLQLISQAETHTNYTGKEKQDYVVTTYLSGINAVDDTQLRAAIDNLVAFSKLVNFNQKGAITNDPGRTGTNGSFDGGTRSSESGVKDDAN